MKALKTRSSQNRYKNWLAPTIKTPIVNLLHNCRNIGWEITGILRPSRWGKSRPVVVTFSGGMGAQIISAAIYFKLKKEGREVYADMSYFEKSPHVAVEGSKGDISYWGWQLQAFDLLPESFDNLPNLHRSKYKVILDGEEKVSLGIKSLSMTSVQEHFEVKQPITDIVPGDFLPNYLCIHVRRGDYVNVASHMVSDEEFLDLANKVSGLVNSVVIVSDSMIPDSFRRRVCGIYKDALFLDKVDAVDAHRVMRNARVLICSNSQFSLVAAILNKRAFTFLPTKWFGDKNHSITKPINDLCNFQVLKST
jgi:hypothetical protein